MGCTLSSAAQTENPAVEVPAAVEYVLETPLVTTYSECETYAATVNKLVFSEEGVTVHFQVQGDGSLGDLQGAESSTLSCGGVDSGAIISSVYAENEPLKKAGSFTFKLSSEQPFGPLVFKYGESGYSEIVLLDLTEEFATTAGLLVYTWAQ
jgi:hypothetical protein